MQKYTFLLVFGFCLVAGHSQSFKLTVNNGYGSGTYQKGDTIHIWAEENDQEKPFQSWTGDIKYIENKRNWHVTLVMPDKDVILSANYGNLPQNIFSDIKYISGSNGAKVEVGLAIPPNYKAIVWLFNGKNSKGKSWNTNIEKKQWVDELLLNNYAVLTMDSYEVTIQNDEDGNGEFGFYYTGDTLTNKDLINVKMVKNALLSDNIIQPNDQHIACGFSSGGAFAEVLAAVYGWPMSFSYNGSGIEYIAKISTTPHFQCNSVNDVDDDGLRNVKGYANYQNYLKNAVCAKWILQDKQPLYRERFHRAGGVSIERSKIIFQGLKDNGALDNKNYLKISPAILKNDYTTNPSKYDAIFGNLGPVQIDNVFDQLEVCYALHAFRSDFNGDMLDFMERLCFGNQYTLTVNGGYGSGMYKPGDPVHVWGGEQPNNKIFIRWQGETQYLKNINEWHTTLTMPDQDVIITAFIPELPANTEMKNLNIKAAENIKKVTLFFPPKQDLKGVVWLWHGTNGFGVNWSKNYDMYSYAKYLMYHHYAVVATDCEERTLDMDLNGDGLYRYSFGIDSNLIDQANIRALRDTFIHRGLMDDSTTNFAAGFSAGGAFSEFLPNIFDWKASYNQSSAGIEVLSLNATKPYYHVISRNDNHPDVGPEGVLESIEYAQNYLDRDVCMELQLYDSQPLHPERFALDGSISVEKSRAIFAEIKSNNGLNSDHTLALSPNEMIEFVSNNPNKFPAIASLTQAQKSFVIDQLGVTYGYHIFKSEYNGRSLDFFEKSCNMPVSTDEIETNICNFLCYPNPTSNTIFIKDYEGLIAVYDQGSKLVTKVEGSSVDLSNLPVGLYYLKTAKGVQKVELIK
ncbi:MAG: T9SS type A sorting domain-containing protein [Saprospiraceae bacterium]